MNFFDFQFDFRHLVNLIFFLLLSVFGDNQIVFCLICFYGFAFNFWLFLIE